jgi:lysine-specific histone demethylase 1B
VDKALAQDFARTLEVPLGLKLEQASLRWAGWESTTNYSGSDAAPEGGYEALVGKVVDEAAGQGVKVELNTIVSGIEEEGDKVKVMTKNGEYTAKTVISTIPLGTLKTLPSSFFSPALPGHLADTISGTHVGVLEKLLLHYPSAWWPNAEQTGSYVFLPTGPVPTESSSIADIFNGSTLICANFAAPALPEPSPTLLTYLSETPARLLLRHDPKDVAQGYHAFLKERFGIDNAPEVAEYNLTNWLTDEYSCGATTTPSIKSELGERSPMDFKELGRPVWGGKLGFAGEHTDMDNRGSVAGAVVSGYREADRVARFLAL